MAFALRQSLRNDSSPASAVCRVHTCVRCQASVESSEPCSFVSTVAPVCRACVSQEHVLSRLPTSRTVWGAGLARSRRA